MPDLAYVCRRFGNELYKAAFPIYRPLYRTFKAYTDRAERRLLADRLKRGSIVVDVGANIGIYSQFLAASVGPTGLVHCFEPSLDNFARLHAALASVTNVRLNQAAVSDKTGQITLYVSDELNVDHRVYRPEGETRRTVAIPSQALDDYFQPGARIDLIKMDIQGHELHALRGAERVLADNAGVMLLLEFWPFGLKQAGASAAELVAFVRARGFSLFQPTERGLIPYDQGFAENEDPSSYTNFFAVRQ